MNNIDMNLLKNLASSCNNSCNNSCDNGEHNHNHNNTCRQNPAVTEFDLLTTRGATQMIKAMIPYLAPKEQKTIGLMVRIWELMGTLKYYSSGRMPLCHNASAVNKNGINTEMIGNLKKYCTPENQQMIDMMLNLMNAQEMMKYMNAFDMNAGNGDSCDDKYNDFAHFDSFCDGDCDKCAQDENHDTMDSFGNLMGMFNQSSIMNQGQVSLYQEFMNKLNDDFSE